MLPGFRFLFAATVLSMSILVFGLGAAALLRAAHEEFASNPSWRAPPETMLAQQAEAPALAMLQIESSAAPQNAPDSVPAIVSATEPAVIFQESSAPETARSEIPALESPAQGEPASVQADARAGDTTGIAAPDAETKTALSGQAPPPQISLPANEAAPVAAEPAAPEQANTLAPPEIDSAATKIATLVPPVTVKPPPAVSKKIDETDIKKRLQARKAAQRRRLAARARLAAQQALQQPFGPFGQPTAQPPAAPRR